ncbi:OLC1v1024288C1 [Oldenlandia corymbosa var. corymbosa]|uniref:OLC1v1024288C1 n=1 Tax=Oldenlandia corymbosa var. corymbosa TaxID=529605 RepID=A0AAV1C4A0_OLDCO|nr:OLC1v1024288C1 [Oldenlandia corymbosa var. corymbosa]
MFKHNSVAAANYESHETALQSDCETVQIGVLLESDSSMDMIHLCLSIALSDFYAAHPDYKSRLSLQIQCVKEELDVDFAVLEMLKNGEVRGVMGPQWSKEPTFAVKLGERAHVPVISFTAKTRAFFSARCRPRFIAASREMARNPDLKTIKDFASTIDSGEKNYRETNGFEAIKDDWTDEDREKIEELAEDLKKLEKYSKVVKWSDMQHYIPAIPVEEKEIINVLDIPVEEKKDEHCHDELYKTLERLEARTRQNPSQERSGLDQEDGPRGEKPAVAIQGAGLCPRPNMRKMLPTGGMAAIVEEINKAAVEYGCHGVAIASLKRLNENRPIKAKWFKQFLKENPKKAMHEALMKSLSKLNVEQLPLWEPLCGALAKMGGPEDISSFLGDLATILSRGPGEKLIAPDVLDEYIGVELEDDDDDVSEEGETGNSGAKKDDPHLKIMLDSWPVHRIHLMILSEEQSKEYPLYSMISTIMRRRAEIHSIETVMGLEEDILDAIQAQNVRVNQHLIEEIKGLQKTRDMELLSGYCSVLQNKLADYQIDFPSFEKLEEYVVPRTRSSQEELLLRMVDQDEEIVDLKDKLNQCVNLLSQHGFKGIIHPSLDNPGREALVIV